MNEKVVKRKGVSKKLRFEVFKRDSFKCQYCGRTAPDVLLHVDHIMPVSKGGINDMTNLITSCQACNTGKSGTPLDDKSAIAKSRAQLEMLQERREQIEMMMTWQKELRNIKDDLVEQLSSYWNDLSHGFSLNENGRKTMKRLLRQYPLEEITTAMDIAAERYLEFDKDGNCTKQSAEIAYHKISGVCHNRKLSALDPDYSELAYIRGILKNRIDYKYDHGLTLQWLKSARSWGATMDELKTMALTVSSWYQFSDAIDSLIERYKISRQ